MIEPEDEPTDPFKEIEYPKKRAFLTAYINLGTVTGAAKQIGIVPGTHYHWMHTDGDYVAAFERARLYANTMLEEVARERAFAGSDTLCIFLLKANDPKRYKDRYEVSGPNDGPVALSVKASEQAEEDALNAYIEAEVTARITARSQAETGGETDEGQTA